MRLRPPIDANKIVRVTQRFNPPSHFGIDYSCVTGTPLYAAAGGVIYTGDQPSGFGLYTRLETDDGFRIYTAHMSRFVVSSGQRVCPGQLIGYSGNTGNSTGPHLHFEIRRDAGSPHRNNAILPEPWIDWHQREQPRAVGYHLGNDTGIQPEDWEIISQMRPGSITLLPDYGINGQPIGPTQVHDILHIIPDCHIILRPYIPPQMAGNDNECWRYLHAVNDMLHQYSFVPTGQLHLQLWNEQNMPRWSGEWEGFGSDHADMVRFNTWMIRGYETIKAVHPRVKVGWTPLTIGNRDLWYPGDPTYNHYLHGTTGCKEPWALTYAEWDQARRSSPCYSSLSTCDELYAHVYISDRDGHQDLWRNEAYGLRYERMQFWWPEKPMWIKEWGHINRSFLEAAGSTQTLEWHAQHIRDHSGVQGTGLWIGGNNPQWGGRMYTAQNTQGLARLNQVGPPPPPLPPPSASLGDWIQQYIVPLNKNAAIAKSAEARNMGLLPASDEQQNGDYIVQAWRSAQTPGVQHIAVCKIPQWDKVTWTTRKN